MQVFYSVYFSFESHEFVANITIRLMRRIKYYVCSNYEVVFKCSVQSTSDYLHLVWTIFTPGHKNRTILLDGNNQSVQIPNLSLNATVVNYNAENKAISSYLHFRLPPVNPRLSSRAYVVCSTSSISKSVPLRYYPGKIDFPFMAEFLTSYFFSSTGTK